MRSTTLLLTDVALARRVRVHATVEDIDDGTCRVTVGAVGVVLTAEEVRCAEDAVAAAGRWEARTRAHQARGGA